MRARLFAVLAALGVAAAAQTLPTRVHFQGRLTDAANNPLTGAQAFDFEIYDDAAAGNLLWSESQPAVAVTNGVFAVELGAVNPLGSSVFAGATAYLRVIVNGTPLAPRERLLASGYAHNAQLLAGKAEGAFVSTRAVTQTIAGDKTFSGTVSVPAPSLPGHAATKAYVDAASGAGLLTATSTWSGENYFVNMVAVSGPFTLLGSTLTVRAGNVGEAARFVTEGPGSQVLIMRDDVAAGGISNQTSLAFATTNDGQFWNLGVDLGFAGSQDFSLRDNIAGMPDRVLVQKNTGNVGLGALNPGARLHVSSGSILSEYGVKAATVTLGPLAAAPTGATGMLYYDSTSDKLRLFNGAWVDLATGTIGGSGSDPTKVAKTGDTMTGQLTLAGSTLTVQGDAFSVGGSTLVAAGGNVGVGTVAPNAPLHLARDLGTTVGPWITLENLQPAYRDWRIGHNADALTFLSGDQNGAPTDEVVKFSYGNGVGINLSAAAAVSAALDIQGTVASARPWLAMRDNGGTTRGYVGVAVNAEDLVTGSVANDLAIRSQNGTILVSADGGNSAGIALKASNRVGVGTLVPGERLHVSSGSILAEYGVKASTAVLGGGDGSGALIVRSTSATSANPILNLQDSAGAEVLRVQEDGKLGLGGAPGSNRLKVLHNNNGAANVTIENGDNGAFASAGLNFATFGGAFSLKKQGPFNSGAGSEAADYGVVSDAGRGLNFVASQTGVGTIKLYTGGTNISNQRMIVNHDGRVGIATGAPVAQLDVQGDAMFGSGATKSTFTAAPGAAVYALRLSSGVTVGGGGPLNLEAGGYLRFPDGTTQATAAGGGNFVSKTGDTMTGQLTLAGSTLTVQGDAFSVGDTTFSVKYGKIGVGIATPGAAVHAYGAGNQFVRIESADALASQLSLGAVVTNGLTESQIQFKNRLGFVAPISGSFVAAMRENLRVGIGTLDPDARLHVSSANAAASDTVVLVSTGSGHADDLFLIDGAGNVAIGTRTPQAQLHVVGNNPSLRLDQGGTWWGAISVGNPLTLSVDTGFFSQPSNGGWQLQPGGESPAQPSYSFKNDVNTGLFGGNDGNYIGFAANGAEQMRIIDGFVGISTRSPQTTLEVGGSASFGAGATKSTFSATGVLTFPTGYTPASPLDAATKGYVDGAAGGGWTKTGSQVILATPTDSVTVQSTLTVQGAEFSVGVATLAVKNGFVGVGESNPGKRLVVRGSGDNGIEVRASGGGLRAELKPSGAEHGQFTLFNNANVQTMSLWAGGNSWISNGGNFAFGTNVPAAGVHVSCANATAASTPLLVSSGTAAGQELLVVKGDGKVGVGTDSPLSALHVRSPTGLLLSNDGLAAPALTPTASDMRLLPAGSGKLALTSAYGTATFQVGGGSFMEIATDGEQIHVAPTVYLRNLSTAYELALRSNGMDVGGSTFAIRGGRVGIATTTPAALLDVNGDAVFGAGATKSTFSTMGVLTFPTGYSPANPLEAATKGYVDGAAGGGWTRDGTVVKLGVATDAVVVQSTLTVQGREFSVGGSTFTVALGRVGVGTTTPSYALSVAPTAGSSGATALFEDKTPATGVTKVIARGGANQIAEPIFEVLSPAGVPVFNVESWGTSANVNIVKAFIGAALDLQGRLGTLSGPSVRASDVGTRAVTDGSAAQMMLITGDFAPASGASPFAGLEVNSSVNQTGTASGVSRGVYVNPTLTRAIDFRALELANPSGWGVYQLTSGVTNYFAGRVGAGVQAPLAQLHVSSSILAAGSLGAPDISGAGTRFMWIPSSAAIRGGVVNGAQWNAANVGAHSTAFGENSTASGLDSAVGGGTGNAASGRWSAVAGGSGNSATNDYTFVGGGLGNQASPNVYATIAGGRQNIASGAASYIGAGDSNVASGSYAVVPGGFVNLAQGNYSFAAGRQAQASAAGAFVWADSQGVALLNKTTDQFLLRAQGGFQAIASSASFTHQTAGALFTVDATSAHFKVPVYDQSGTLLGGGGGWTKTGSQVILATPTDNATVQSTFTVQGEAFSVGASTFVVTGGTVIIGGTAANLNTMLDVSGNLRTARIGVGENPDNSYAIKAAGNIRGYTLSGDQFETNASGAAGQIKLKVDAPTGQTGDLQQWLVNGAALAAVDATGDFGIGVLAPTARLHVSSANAVAANTLLMVSSGTGVGQELMFVKGNGQTVFNNSAVNFSDIGVLASGTRDRAGFAVNTVSFGETDPWRFHAAGLIGPYAGEGQLNIYSGWDQVNWVLDTDNSAPTASYFRIYQGAAPTANPGKVFEVRGDGQVEIGGGATKSTFSATGVLTFPTGYSPANPLEAATKAYVDGAAGGGWTRIGTQVILANAGDSVTAQSTMTVQGQEFSVSNATFAVTGGQVGVGTAAPDSILDVTSASGDIKLKVTNAHVGDAYNLGFVGTNGRRVMMQSLQGTQQQSLVFGDSGGAMSDTILGLAAQSGAGWNPVFVAKQGGDFGVGTNAPSARLHVSSAAANAVDALLRVSTGALASEQLLVVKGDGKVGVGTETPLGRVDIRYGVNGSTAIYARRATDSSPTGSFFHFQDAAGTTDSIARLTERGRLELLPWNASIGGIKQVIQIADPLATPSSEGTYIGINRDGSNDANFLRFEEGDALRFRVGPDGRTEIAATGSEAFIVNGSTFAVLESGDVGIRTKTPAANLDVVGNAQFGSGAAKSTFSAAGVLTFPTGYSPANPLDAASKGYVDGQAGGGWTRTGTQVILANPGDSVTAQSTMTVQGPEFSVGGSTFVVKGSSVGIGTVAPQAQLHVSSSVQIGGALASGFNSGNLVVHANESSNLGIRVTLDNFYTSYMHNSGLKTFNNPLTLEAASSDFGGIAFKIVGSEKMTLNRDRLGVGVISPSARLHVSSAAAAAIDSILLVSSGTAAGQELLVVKGDGKIGIGIASPATNLHMKGDMILEDPDGGSSDLAIEFRESGTVRSYVRHVTADDSVELGNADGPRLTMDAAGRIGISTITPATALDVAGNAQFGSGAAKSTFSTTGVLTFPFGYSPAAPLQAATKGYVDSQIGGGWTRTGTQVILANPGDSVTAQSTMTILGSEFSVGGTTLAVRYGGVGIGTDAPENRLHVYNDFNLPLGVRIENPNAGAAAYSQLELKNDEGFRYDLEIGGSQVTDIPNGFAIWQERPSEPGAYRLVIDEAGRVGISTRTPATTLDVAGSAQFGSGALKSTFTAAGDLNVGDDLAVAGDADVNGTLDVGTNFRVDGNGDLSDPAGSIIGVDDSMKLNGAARHFWAEGTGNHWFNGNLGVGTMTVSARLHVSSDTTPGAAPTTNVLLVSTGIASNQNLFVVKGDGKIGFGTLTPASDFVVDTTRIGTGGSTLVLGNNQNFGDSIRLGVNGRVSSSNSLFRVQSEAGVPVTIETADSGSVYQERVRVESGGEVGVGTNAPEARLHVSSGAATPDSTNIVLVTTGSTNLFRVQATGDVFALGAFTGGGADLAEMYPSAGPLEKGELAMLRPDGKVARFDGTGRPLGIVSTDPGTLLGWTAKGSEMPGHSKIALAGRVPAKVLGEVAVGDDLAAAERPGWMRKAKAGELTVGIALESSEAAEGRVVAYVRLGDQGLQRRIRGQQEEIEELKRRLDKLESILTKARLK